MGLTLGMSTASATIILFLYHMIAVQVGVSPGYAGVPGSSSDPAAGAPPLNETVTTTDKGLIWLHEMISMESGAYNRKERPTTGIALVFKSTVLHHIRQVERHTKCYFIHLPAAPALFM